MDKQRQKYKGLLDMIDGGGAGAVGNEFEGGGILSVIANALATPYGSEDRMRDAMHGQRPVSRSAAMDSIETLSSQNSQNDLSPFGGVGPNISGFAAERGMGLGPFGGAGPNIGNALGGEMPLTSASDIPGYIKPERPLPLTSASDIPGRVNSLPDPFSYSGNRNAGMDGKTETPGRYDFLNDLPDDANDFATGLDALIALADTRSPELAGQGSDQSPNYSAPKDAYISQIAPTNLPDVPSQGELPNVYAGSGRDNRGSGINPSNSYLDPKQRFAVELVELIGPSAAENYLGTGAGEQLYNNYVNNGYKFLNY